MESRKPEGLHQGRRRAGRQFHGGPELHHGSPMHLPFHRPQTGAGTPGRHRSRQRQHPRPLGPAHPKSASSKAASITPRPSPASATTSSAAADPLTSRGPWDHARAGASVAPKRACGHSCPHPGQEAEAHSSSLALEGRGAGGLAWALAQAASGPPPAIQGRTMPLPSRSSTQS